MCRNISNMLFVLFAVVLGLPASKGGSSELDENNDYNHWRSGTRVQGTNTNLQRVSANNPLACYRAVEPVGEILCELYGYGKFQSGGLDYVTCELKCEGGNVPLPKEACSYNGVPSGCSEEVAQALKKWSAAMTKSKDDLIEKWCTSANKG